MCGSLEFSLPDTQKQWEQDHLKNISLVIALRIVFLGQVHFRSNCRSSEEFLILKSRQLISLWRNEAQALYSLSYMAKQGCGHSHLQLRTQALNHESVLAFQNQSSNYILVHYTLVFFSLRCDLCLTSGTLRTVFCKISDTTKGQRHWIACPINGSTAIPMQVCLTLYPVLCHTWGRLLFWFLLTASFSIANLASDFT